MGLVNSLEYRFDFFIGILSTVFPVIIQVYLWSAIFSGSGSETMYGYSFTQMMAYIAIAGTVSKFVVTGIENLVNDDIHSGGLAVFLVKPVKYIPFRIFQMIGQKLVSTIIMIIFTVIVMIVLHFIIGFNVAFSTMLLFIPAIILAIILNFYLFFLVSISAFWLTEVGRFFHTIQIVIMVISGGIFPITVLGNTFVSIVKFLPFTYTIYFPISVVMGVMNSHEIFIGMLIQIIWIAVLYLLTRQLWNMGIKKYVAVGG